MSDHRTRTRTRTRVAATAACLGAAVLTVAIGVHPASAGAVAAHTAGTAHITAGVAHTTAAAVHTTATTAGPGLGSGNLVQSGDFYQQGMTPLSATVDLTGDQALSACSGEESMRTLTQGKAAAYADVAWTFEDRDSYLTESVADASTAKAAAADEKLLNALVRDCQDEVAGHWYFGPAHAVSFPSGTATWYTAFSGDGVVSGGVAVIRGGQRFGIVELTGQPGDDPGYVKGITAAAVSRLAL
ncbi:hypothetical protein V2S66_04860 [Streptomyces sp. V4-01]|uniref:PknH-like extracellular domain-containing protein n=1 Tax=Actinacidiphila polyblastidii TaxID=3110430 RepID=A0ABU7P652_9ACTN|nr:hypothetical protein [Streptomyces sp. V4-01]